MKYEFLLKTLIIIFSLFLTSVSVFGETEKVNISATVLPQIQPQLQLQIGGGALFDRTGMTNVNFFKAKPGDKKIFLSWQNPDNLDFAFVLIERSEEFFPLVPNQNFLVYKGKDQSFLDKNLINGKTYYYTIWAYDRAGNFSSGAISSAVPKALAFPSEKAEIPEIPAKLPIMLQPIIPAKEKIGLENISFFANAIKIQPKEGIIRILPNALLSIFIPFEKFVQPAKVIQIILESQTFILNPNKEKKVYEGTIKVSENSGSHPLIILIVYEDGTVEIINAKILAEIFGQVYTGILMEPSAQAYKIFKNLNLKINEGIKQAMVTLYWFDKETNELKVWPGDKYYQKNPQFTDEEGEYGYMVPPGKYFLSIIKKGYLTGLIKEFEVKDNIINLKIWLLPWWFWIVIGISIVLIIVLITRFLLILRKRRAQNNNNNNFKF